MEGWEVADAEWQRKSGIDLSLRLESKAAIQCSSSKTVFAATRGAGEAVWGLHTERINK